MNQYVDYFKQAELALAAYANLITEVPDQAELQRVGFSAAQARDSFIPTYRVVEQYNDPNTGLSATIFRHTTDVDNTNSILAIRGTELSDINDLFAGLSIAAVGTTQLQPQYDSLKIKVGEWLTSGTISPTFTVAGHSLGGFLATGLVADFPSNVSHAYLYNTPGLGGILGSMTNAILEFLGIAKTIDATKFSNIEAATGISPIAGLGYDVSPPIDIIIEDQTNPDTADTRPDSLNYSQQVLTDTLAVYSLYSQLLPGFNQDQHNGLMDAFGSIKSNTSESNVLNWRQAA